MMTCFKRDQTKTANEVPEDRKLALSTLAEPGTCHPHSLLALADLRLQSSRLPKSSRSAISKTIQLQPVEQWKTLMAVCSLLGILEDRRISSCTKGAYIVVRSGVASIPIIMGCPPLCGNLFKELANIHTSVPS